MRREKNPPKQNSTTNQKSQTRGRIITRSWSTSQRQKNHRLGFTVGSTTVLTFDLCMHQRTHSAETVQTRVYHATSSVNNVEISPSFVNSLHGDPSHPYMAAALREQKKNNFITFYFQSKPKGEVFKIAFRF